MFGTIIENFADGLILALFFGMSIFIHELGHFLVALKLGLVVDTFSIGFGPAIWKKKINGIVYKLSWFPLGGYVALPQLDPTGMSTVQGVSEDGKEVTHRQLPEISPIRKIAVACAGATGNIILAVVAACIIWVSPGAITYKGDAVVSSVDERGSAYSAGLRAGDQILAVNGEPVSTWYSVSMELLMVGKSADVELLVQSGKEQKTLTVPVVKAKGAEVPMIVGIERQSTPCMLKGIVSGGSADKAGLRENDIVKSFDGVKVAGANEFIRLLTARVDKSVSIVVARDDKEVESTVVPQYSVVKTKRALIGVGIEPQGDRCVFTSIRFDSPAAEAGLRENDVAKKFDGVEIKGVEQFINLVAGKAGKRVPIVVERNGEEVELTVVPKRSLNVVSIGAQPMDIVMPWMQEKGVLAQLKADAGGIVRILKALVTPKESKHAAGGLGGPLMIFAALWMAIKMSIFNAVGFVRFLNINLAILNMLPIPILDGGHVVFSLWELVTRRKINAKVVNVLVNGFAILFLGAFLILTTRDVDRLFPGVKRMLHIGQKSEAVATNVVETAAASTNMTLSVTNSLPAWK